MFLGSISSNVLSFVKLSKINSVNRHLSEQSSSLHPVEITPIPEKEAEFGTKDVERIKIIDIILQIILFPYFIIVYFKYKYPNSDLIFGIIIQLIKKIVLQYIEYIYNSLNKMQYFCYSYAMFIRIH